MKKIFIFCTILLVSIFVIAAQNSPYARRIRPVSAFGACAENEIAFDMVGHVLGICTNTGYKTVLTSGGSGFVTSVFGRSGTVVAATNDYNFNQLAGTATYSQLVLTGAILNTDLAGSIAASKLIGTDITTIGTITSGTWNGSVINSTYGGTGINNAGRTLTINTNNGIFSFGASGTHTFPANTGTVGELNLAQVWSAQQTFTSPKILTDISDTNGNELLKFTAPASAINELTIVTAAAGNNPAINISGDDTNIGLTVLAKGSGELSFGGATSKIAIGQWSTASFVEVRKSGATQSTNYSLVTNGSDTYINAGSSSNIYFGLGGAVKWRVDSTSALYAQNDNGSDIGASSTNRPRTGYFGTSVITSLFSNSSALSITTTAGNGNITLDPNGTGSVIIATANPLAFQSGTNTRAGNATLVSGTVTVSNTTVTANTIVMLTRKTSGGTIGTAITYTVSAGTSFTIASDNVLDTSTFSYLLIENP